MRTNDELLKIPKFRAYMEGFIDEGITPEEFLSHPERFELVALVLKEAQPKLVETEKGDYDVVINAGNNIIFKMIRKKEDNK